MNIDEILESVFKRGYNHGISGGMSEDGESLAVSDAKDRIKALMVEVVGKDRDFKSRPRNKSVTAYLFENRVYNQAKQEIRERIGEL